jgi:sodium/hydrogen antiporter
VEQFSTLVALIGVVIVAASLLSSTFERTGVPLAALFLALGAVLGPSGLRLIDVGIDSHVLRVLATLGLVLVLFSDAVTIQLADIRRHRQLLWRLLGPGTLFPAALTALAGWLLLGLSPTAAAILGAALASTDAILLRRVLRARVLPTTAQVALRLETGMNDIVLLPIIVMGIALLAGGDGATRAGLARSGLSLLLLGPAVGALIGWLGVVALVRVRSRSGVRRDYEALYGLALAFMAYAIAEGAGGSGFVAAFAAGLTVSAQDLELCDCFLEYGEATSLMLLLLTYVAFGASLIWTGMQVLDARTLLFAVVALTVRTVVLLGLLPASVPWRERKLIALLGPRGISSLLLSLLPVFAGVPGAEYLFAVTCLVVLLSIVAHGSGMALFLRAHSIRAAGTTGQAQLSTAELPERITLDELNRLRAAGEPIVIVDARTDRSLNSSTSRARDSLRVTPDDPVSAAEALAIPKAATLAVYCT